MAYLSTGLYVRVVSSFLLFLLKFLSIVFTLVSHSKPYNYCPITSTSRSVIQRIYSLCIGLLKQSDSQKVNYYTVISLTYFHHIHSCSTYNKCNVRLWEYVDIWIRYICLNGGIYYFSSHQTALWTVLFARPSIRPPVCHTLFTMFLVIIALVNFQE